MSCLVDSPSFTTLKLLLYYWHQLSSARRIQFYGITLLILTNYISELLSITLVLLLISCFTGEISNTSLGVLAYLPKGLITGINEGALLTFLFVVASLACAFLRLAITSMANSYYASIGSDIAKSTFQKTSYSPYLTHISRNSPYIISILAIQLNTTYKVLGTWLSLITNAFISLALIFTLFLINCASGSLFIFSSLSDLHPLSRYYSKSSIL